MLASNYTAYFEHRDGLSPKQKSKFWMPTLQTHFLRVDSLILLESTKAKLTIKPDISRAKKMTSKIKQIFLEVS